MTQFLRDQASDSEEVVTPLMLDGTYLSRNFATLGPSSLTLGGGPPWAFLGLLAPWALGRWVLRPWGPGAAKTETAAQKTDTSAGKKTIHQQRKPMTLAMSDKRISQPKSASVISNSHIGKPLCLEGLQFAKKGFQKALGCPKPKSGQFHQQTTYVCMHVCMYWEVICSKAPISRKKPSKRPPGRPRPKSGQFYQHFHIGKLLL